MAFVQLFLQRAVRLVDHAAALDGGAHVDPLRPAHQVLVAGGVQEFGGVIGAPQHQAAIPGPDRHVGDRIIFARHIVIVRQMPVEHVQLPLHLHGIAVDRIFVFFRRIGVEMTKAAAQQGAGAHLPEEPAERRGARRRIGRQEHAEFFGEIEQDRAGFEHALRRRDAMVHQRRDLAVGIDRHEAAGKLVALADADEPCVIIGGADAGLQQFLQHDRHLLPVGRGERIKLQLVVADRQVLVMGRAGDRPVDVGELAAAGLVPGPDLGRSIGGIAHGEFLLTPE